jgi:uncharacterized protein YodC (DUF2158 family)
MAYKFDSGDVVTLKSGGPEMTIDSFLSADNAVVSVVRCVWYNHTNGCFEKQDLATTSLRCLEDKKW